MGNSHPTPLTLKLITAVNDKTRTLGLGNEGLRRELNKRLSKQRQIKDSHSGIVQLSRWLNPTSANWPEPKAEIALAMKAFLDDE